MSIATGLMNSLSQRISDRITYLEKKREADRDYLMTYGTRAVRETEDKANAVIAQGKFLEGMGMSPEKIDYVVSRYGIPALSQLYSAVAENKYTKEDLNSGELLNSMVTFADDYETDEFSWEDFTRRSFGLYKDADKSTPANRASGWFHSLLGLNPRTADQDTYIGGYTEADIRRIMGASAPTLMAAPTYDLYGALPKKHDSSTMKNLNSKIEDSLDTLTKNWLAGEQSKLATYTEEQKKLHTKITNAYNTKDYAFLAQNVPDAKQIILDSDKYSRGAVQQGAKQGWMPLEYLTFFEEAKAAAGEMDIPDRDTGAGATGAGATGAGGSATDVSLLQADYELAKKDDPNIAPLDDLPRFNTDEEFIAANVKFGVVGVGTAAEVKTNTSVTASTDQQDDLEATSDKTIDLGDMTGAPGFREERSSPEVVAKVEQAFDPDAAEDKDLTVEEQAEQRYDAVQTTIDDTKKSAGQATVDIATVITNIYDIGQRQATKFKWNTTNWATTELGTIAQYFGYEDLAKDLYKLSIKNKDRGTSSLLLSQQINDIFDSFGWADYSEGVNLPSSDTEMSGAGPVLGAIPLTDMAANFIRFLSREKPETDTLTTSALDTEQRQGLEDFILAAQRRAYKPASSQEEGDEKPIYTIEDIKAYAENRLGAREKQAMEDRIRDDARQFLQDEKSFPQPLPTIVIEKLEDDIIEEAKVDVEVMRIVQQLDKKGEVPSRKDIEDLKTTLELNQEIDTETQELYRGPISGKTLVEKLDDIYNFYTKGEEPDFNPRAVGTVGFRDLGLRDTTDDVRPPRDKGPELGDEPANLENPESELGFFTKPRNMMVESMLTRGKRVPADELESPEGEESGFEVSTGSMYTDMAELIERVHGGGSKFTQLADDIADTAIRGDKVKVADITRLINATEKLRSTKTRSEVLRSLYAMRDRLNKR